ncbi:MAG TPA: S26 family signal peptidase [Flavobacteriales bacterium]|nr:S26 family signal peptidase [Flavobacteriales bacterium]HRE74358.1 S26 family signal peptidase [Flavobacteriales bacterium]HRJ35930.1 S26 family signal peptidase [Flavobacteriales bacterium]
MEKTIANALLLLLIAVYFASLYKIFEKAGRNKKWEGFVPGYNVFVWIKILNKPWWWILLMLVPGVNFLMLIVLNVELSRSFNLRSFKDDLLMVLFPWYFIYRLAYNPELKFVGPLEFKNPAHKKPMGREWFDALMFAVIAATIIRTLFLEAFKIPSPSMEKNLLVGDFLFVSKVSYGAKLPETPISFPFTHNTMPVGNGKSYLEIFTLPHLRLPGFGSVKRNDVVVFNFPAGDSVYTDNTNVTYYQFLNQVAFEQYINRFGDISITADSLLVQHFTPFLKPTVDLLRADLMKQDKIISRPVDKRDNYIKRCVGIPGDVIEVIDRQLFVNGEPSGNTDGMQFNYNINANSPIAAANNGQKFKSFLKEKFDVNSDDCNILDYDRGQFIVPLTNEKLAQMQQIYGAANVRPVVKPKGHYQSIKSLYKIYDEYNYLTEGHNQYLCRDLRYLPIFPNDIRYDWSEDNFGPLKIPACGETVELNLENLPMYARIIDVYEKNDLEIKDGKIYINGAESTAYTFKMNYYWLMGDNRQNSADSRFWGFVPEDHVVGKAVLVWFSTDPETGIRWNRVFKGIR